MTETTSQLGRTYSYRAVEDALGAVFGTDDRTILQLRARLKVFQRSGLTPETPGRGKVIRYMESDVYDWAWALALSDFNISPGAICEAVVPGQFSRSYIPFMATIGAAHAWCVLLPSVFKTKNNEAGATLNFAITESSQITASKISQFGGRVGLIDLSDLKDKIDAALAKQR